MCVRKCCVAPCVACFPGLWSRLGLPWSGLGGWTDTTCLVFPLRARSFASWPWLRRWQPHWIDWNIDMCFFLLLRWYGGFLRITWSGVGVFWCIHLVVKLGRPDAGIQDWFSPDCGDAHGIVVRDSCCNMFLLFGFFWKALLHSKISNVSNVVYQCLNEQSFLSGHCIFVCRC